MVQLDERAVRRKPIGDFAAWKRALPPRDRARGLLARRHAAAGRRTTLPALNPSGKV